MLREAKERCVDERDRAEEACAEMQAGYAALRVERDGARAERDACVASIRLGFRVPAALWERSVAAGAGAAAQRG